MQVLKGLFFVHFHCKKIEVEKCNEIILSSFALSADNHYSEGKYSFSDFNRTESFFDLIYFLRASRAVFILIKYTFYL